MSGLRGKVRTGVRRIAAKILGEYPPPRLRHADELLAGLSAAGAAAGEWGPLAASIAAALRGGAP